MGGRYTRYQDPGSRLVLDGSCSSDVDGLGPVDLQKGDLSFGVQVKLVGPGYAPTTRFASNRAARMQGLIPEAYAACAASVFAALGQPARLTTEADVADGIWRAASDSTGQLRFPAGADAVALANR